MDDHLFFSWLAQTSWREAIWQRLTGNWILNFSQMQMYRPVSGIWQALTFQLFGINPLPHHLVSFLLHLGTSLLAGILASRLSNNEKAGWLSGGLLLLHPRASLGVSLIFNFYDPLVSFLMVASLLCLFSIRQRVESRHLALKRLGLWAGVGLALGSKETALPMVAVLILADLMWEGRQLKIATFLSTHAVPLALLVGYLLARNRFVGHPFQSHTANTSFPLPPDSAFWTILWDGLVIGSCLGAASFLRYWPKVRRLLPEESSWMILWCGAMLLPAVHFCSQVSLKPWFFDERYWYVPLVPLNVLSGTLLVSGTLFSSLLGTAVLALTFPSPLGFFLALMILPASRLLNLRGFEKEVQTTVFLFFAAATGFLLWLRCEEIRLRADEAQNVRSQIAEILQSTPGSMPIGILNFTERSVEPKGSFNGDLQWLLQPPFFERNLTDRIFFAYPTWDSPPTNRFRDRTTPGLLKKLDNGEVVNTYLWNAEEGKVKWIGTDSRASLSEGALPLREIRMLPFRDSKPVAADEKLTSRIWRSDRFSADPKSLRYLKFIFGLPKRSEPLQVLLRWVSSRSRSPAETNEFRFGFGGREDSIEATVWLFPGEYVDWLLSGEIVGIEITANQQLQIKSAQLMQAFTDEELKEAKGLDHYENAAATFNWIGRAWWDVKK